MTASPEELLQNLDIPPVVQLFRVLHKGQTYCVTNTMFEGELWWAGEKFTSFPVTLSNIGYTEDNASDTPRLTLSNVGGEFGLIFPMIPELKGAVVEYVLTFQAYTGAISGLETALFISKHRFKVAKLVSRSRLRIVYDLDGLLGFAGVKLPRRQMLREGEQRLRFPGLGYNKSSGG